MNEADRQTLAAKLSYLQRQLKQLARYRRLSASQLLKNFERRLAVERLLELSIQAVIDSSRMLVSLQQWHEQDTLRDSLQILADHRVITTQLARRLQMAKAFRNILVHEYAEIDPQRLVDHLQNDVDDLMVYAASIARYMKLHSEDHPDKP